MVKQPVRLIQLVLMFAGLAGCRNPATSTSPANTTPSPSSAALAAPAAISLDIILGGPFAVLQLNDGITVWVPDVKGHSKPLGTGLGAEIRSFEQGNYDFTKGIESSNSTTVMTPVSGAAPLFFSLSKDKISNTPKKKPYLTIKLPTPREIVPWNADPVTVSDGATGVRSMPNLLSTVTILRYNFSVGDTPLLTAPGQPSWSPKPIVNGSEHVLLLGVIPPTVQGSGDQHQHARRAFRELTKVLGIKRTIDFPSTTYTRNQPIVSGVLPPDLLQVLTTTLVDRTSSFGPDLKPVAHIFGKINDCKAPAAVVTP